MAKASAGVRDELAALEASNRLLSSKLLEERVTALTKTRELAAAQKELNLLRADVARLEEDRTRLSEKIDDLEQSALQNSTSTGSSDEAEILRLQLEKAEANLRVTQAKIADIDRTNSEEKDQLATEIDQLRKKLAVGGGATSGITAKLQAEIDEKDTLILEQDSIIEEERKKAEAFDAELHRERQHTSRLLDEKEKVILNLQHQLASGGHGGSAGHNDELLHQFNALKETYGQEMEKKKQFSLVFLKLKSEFEEQKKKLAAYESAKK